MAENERIEIEKVANFKKEVEVFFEVKRMKVYIEAKKEAYFKTHNSIEDDLDFSEWLKLANKIIDDINPIKF
ncbi:MAG: hypothetical protein ACEPO8_05345 [Rhodothermaceae bacterium]